MARIAIVHESVVAQEVDAIVNAAKPTMLVKFCCFSDIEFLCYQRLARELSIFL